MSLKKRSVFVVSDRTGLTAEEAEMYVRKACHAVGVIILPLWQT